jgi:hypothetical protein
MMKVMMTAFPSLCAPSATIAAQHGTCSTAQNRLKAKRSADGECVVIRWRRRHCGHRVPRWAIGLCAASVLLLLAVLAVLTFTLIIPKVIDTLMADSTIEFELIRLSKPGSSSLFLDAQGIKATPT